MREMAYLPGTQIHAGQNAVEAAVEVDVVEALSQGPVGLEEGIRDRWQEGCLHGIVAR